MKTVFVVSGSYDYEGADVLGVFTTRKRAENWKVKVERYESYDTVYVQEFILNGESDKR